MSGLGWMEKLIIGEKTTIG